jgi:hypothetical protein
MSSRDIILASIRANLPKLDRPLPAVPRLLETHDNRVQPGAGKLVGRLDWLGHASLPPYFGPGPTGKPSSRSYFSPRGRTSRVASDERAQVTKARPLRWALDRARTC